MPIAYACICPPAVHPDGSRTADAVERMAEELRAAAPDLALVVTPPSRERRNAIGVATQGGAIDVELARRVLDAAEALTMPSAELAAPDALACPKAVREALGGARLVVLSASVLAAREHVELGRAIARVLQDDERRIAIVCCGTLASARGPGEPGDVFDKHFRLAIEDWDVKWLAALDAETRRRAHEDCAAQTAVLMGALSRSRIQPRVLSYEAPEGVGLLVAAVDALGDRRKKRGV